MTHNWICIQSALLLALALLSLSCATTGPKHEASEGDELMAAFEVVQMKGGEPDAFLLNSRVDEQGKVIIYRTASVWMDRFVHIWGEGGPAVPVFFSARSAMRFSILEAHARSALSLSESGAQEWAWKNAHEPPRPEAPR